MTEPAATAEPSGPLLSVVVPVLNEAPTLPRLLGDLRTLRTSHEVVVADGGSTDGGAELAEQIGAQVIRTGPGRGGQLAAGAAVSRGAWFLFLHADVQFGTDAGRAVDHVVEHGEAGLAYAFRFAIDARGLGYRVIEWGTNLRARWLQLPYGDQGLLIRRADYERSGGFPPYPIMEDVALVRRLRNVASLRLLDAPLTVSPRRWQRSGLLRSTLRNWALLAAYSCGVPPSRLARAYRPEEL